MTLEELRVVVAGLSYRPEWDFTVEDSTEGPVFAITAKVHDASQKGWVASKGPDLITLYILSHIPPMRDAVHFLEWVDWRVRRVAIHEHEEFLRLHGTRVNNPQHGA